MKSKIIDLIRPESNLPHEAFEKLIVKAQKKFKSLNYLLNSDWHSEYWFYKKNTKKILFQTLKGKKIASELKLLMKVALVELLSESKLIDKSYSHSYVRNILLPYKILAEMGITKINEINQIVYDDSIHYLKLRYKSPVEPGQLMNRLVNFLNENHLLNANIDTVCIVKALGKFDKFGRRLVKEEKIPLPELVRAIIHLKCAVEDQFNGSFKAINDKLCVYTQAFQYGLGLRIGEVLRLPYKPLIEKDGDLYCLVWTEKGSIPIARYVPKLWRPVLQEAVDEITKITDPSRKYAKELEDNHSIALITDRVEALIKQKKESVEEKQRQLLTFLNEKKEEANRRWKLKREVDDNEEIPLKKLPDILPFFSTANDATSQAKAYRSWGLKVTSKSLGSKKHKHFITGKNINAFVGDIVKMRGTYLTKKEVMAILNDKEPQYSRAKITLINECYKNFYGKAICFTFLPTSRAACVALANLQDIQIALEKIVSGGYDYSKYISLHDLGVILPEQFYQTPTANSCIYKGLKIIKNQVIYVKGKRTNYSKCNAALLEINQIQKYILSNFQQSNINLQEELIKDITEEYNELGITISSKSFSIKQKVSEYLFIRPSSRGAEFYELIPEIMSYYSIRYFFLGNEKYPSAFHRYKIQADEHVLASWQSHKGRHWQTTSLFRAGLAAMVTNKWMGRTDTQGGDYDHNTGKERAQTIGKAMLDNSDRYLGEVATKIKKWKKQDISVSQLTDHVDSYLTTAQYSPLGYCTRDLYLKPCEFNLQCLTGNNGKGCKHYIYDLKDPAHREKVLAEKDKSTIELGRLFEAYEKGIKAAEMHIKHHMTIVRNTTAILNNAEIILDDTQLKAPLDFRPFMKDGSYPTDCPFQCGGDD